MSSGNLSQRYHLDFFSQNDFTRIKCESCGDMFWCVDKDRISCGEPPCGQYNFIGNPRFNTEFTLEEMRSEFLSFFEEENHDIVEPYPVAANRWRDDVLLTQASIYNFQPHITSGSVRPPSNPLTISQPCIRMNDIENVGKTGRHTMAFEMMAHHCFNSKESSDAVYTGEVYWKERTVELCHSFLEYLGADTSNVTYIEDTWVGGGNAGLSFEVIYEGAELATLVFMSMEEDESGEYKMKDGNRYEEMDTYIVDTGYGLERWAWVSQGTPTVYDALYPDIVDDLVDSMEVSYSNSEMKTIREASKLAGRMDIDDTEDLESSREQIADAVGVPVEELERLMEPMEAVYAIADHSRALAYMIGDRIVPSSSGTGYLVRKITRRAIDKIQEFEISIELSDLVSRQSQMLGYENNVYIKQVVDKEVERYKETLRKGREKIETIIEKRGEITNEQVVSLYKNDGIEPSIVKEICNKNGLDIDIPDMDELLRDDEKRETKNVERLSSDVGETELLYYEDAYMKECKSQLLDIVTRDETEYAVLDRTVFYPEGGGQPSDMGYLTDKNGDKYEVTDVQIEDNIVFHELGDTLPKETDILNCRINWGRRYSLTKSHTATHLVGRACRDVLGDHIRQSGAKKGVDESRLDITQYKDISIQDLQEIERVVNSYLREQESVDVLNQNKRHVHDEYGFNVYQGGVPKSTEIRIIEIGDDVQACGGTHVKNTRELNIIKINNIKKLQEGVYRILFSVDDSAISKIQNEKGILSETADILDVEQEHIPTATRKFFQKSKEQEKEIQSLKTRLAEARAGSSEDDTFEVQDINIGIKEISGDGDEMKETAKMMDYDLSIVLSYSSGRTDYTIFSTTNQISSGAIAKRIGESFTGGGGGDETMGRGSCDGNVVQDIIQNIETLVSGTTGSS